MNYQLLLRPDAPVRVALIGAGAFGKSFLFQAARTPNLQVLALCDQDVGVARAAWLHGGVAAADLAVCNTTQDVRTALERGQKIITADAMLLMETPVAVVIEASGSPAAGARHGLAALDAGKHVIMVSKEAAAVVGPILAHKAHERGLVYTTGDGDQPSMCIGLISWAQTIGLEVVCAGKAAEADFIYDVAAGTVSNSRQSVQVAQDDLWPLWATPADRLSVVVQARQQVLAALPRAGVPEYTEMAIVINDTGYGFDGAELHAPVVRIAEIPDILRPVAEGGILSTSRVIDVVNCLRRSDEPGFAGGVFVVVKCHDRATWSLLQRKGHLLSRDGAHAMIYLPYHLLGVETATSVLAAAVLGLPTGGQTTRPQVEVAMQATTSLAAGHRLAMDHGHAIAGVTPRFVTPNRVDPQAPIPFYMAAGNVLRQAVNPGEIITYAMIEEPDAAVLWSLKRAQDRQFL